MADKTRAMQHDLGVRWLRNDEIEMLVQLDQAIFDHPWHRDTINEIVNLRSNLCAVVEGPDKRPIGFAIFESKADRFYILKMGVLKEHRRAGFGCRLFWFLADRLSKKRNKIEIDVREKLALESHAFYSKFGFLATGVRNNFFKEYDATIKYPSHVEDSYNFVFECVSELPLIPEDIEKQEVLEIAGCSLGGIEKIDREFL